MKKTLIPLLVIASFLLGCESTPHYNRTKVVTFSQPLPKKPYGSVKLYQSKEEVQGSYDVIAMMSVEGKAGEEAQFIKAVVGIGSRYAHFLVAIFIMLQDVDTGNG